MFYLTNLKLHCLQFLTAKNNAYFVQQSVSKSNANYCPINLEQTVTRAA